MVRSLAAAARRAERDAERRQRAAEREQRRIVKETALLDKQIAKKQELRAAASEASESEARLRSLIDVHKTCSPDWHWQSIADAPAPEPPIARKDREAIAVAELNAYKPTFLEKLLGRDKERIQALCEAVVVGARNDCEDSEKAQMRFQEEYARWSIQKQIADRILAGDMNGYSEALQALQPYKRILDSARGIEVTPHDKNTIEVWLELRGEEIIPHEDKTISASGRLCVKRIPRGQVLHFYQEYVCGCALRIARDTFALIPAEMVIVTVVTEILDTQTGHRDPKPILSVAMPRQTISGLDFSSLNPVDAMVNFIHRMDFRRSEGFSSVESLKHSDFKPGCSKPTQPVS